MGTASPIAVPGLTNGMSYTFTVAATNAVGTGAASSPSNSVTPKGVVQGAAAIPTLGEWALALLAALLGLLGWRQGRACCG